MKRILFGLCCFLSFSIFAWMPVRAAEPVIVTDIPAAASVIFSEIYANGQNLNPHNAADETGSEFVELLNRSGATVDLSGYELVRTDTNEHFTLNGSLPAGGYVSVQPQFTLVNSGGTVALRHTASNVITSVTYTATAGSSDENSWQLLDAQANTWHAAAPTSGQPPAVTPEPNPEEPPVTPPPAEEPSAQPPCSVQNIHLSEIAANPSGSDAEGGEFIEFYNSGDAPASLEGCTLTTDKMDAFAFTATHTVAPKAYTVINLADKLLNSGGTVTFETASYEEVVRYGATASNEAWILLNNTWQVTTLATPNAPNMPSPGRGSAHDTEAETETAAAPCPEGKFRNPTTGRCKAIEAETTQPAPCEPGKIRNLETNRCRAAITTAVAAVTPCQSGQERNPETNRCRKIASGGSEPTPCKDGYERNPETNRCRKITTPIANTAHIEPPKQQNQTRDLLIISMAVAAIAAFLVFEYRHALWAQLQKIKSKNRSE